VRLTHYLSPQVTHQGAGAPDIEVYPRPDGTVYTCAFSTNDWAARGSKADADMHSASEEEFSALTRTAVSVLPMLSESGITTQLQACYLPILDCVAGPVVGPVPGVDGLHIATGHSCWGGLTLLRYEVCDVVVPQASCIALAPDLDWQRLSLTVVPHPWICAHLQSNDLEGHASLNTGYS
jgi:hypothetical protein